MPPSTQAASRSAVGRACRSCGGAAIYRPRSNGLGCRYCDHVEPIEVPPAFRAADYDLTAGLAAAHRGPATEIAQGGREIQCKTCGARAVVTGQATRCVFCDAPMVVEIQAAPDQIIPETILPFVVDHDDAGGAFAKWMASRWFAPNDLVKRAQKQALDGIYLPYWTYDSATTTDYTGQRGDDYTETEHYTDASGKRQTRSVTRTRWRSASGTVHVPFDDVLVCASQSVPEQLVDKLEPWNLAVLRPFDDRYLAGFSAERYAVDLEAGFERAKQKMNPVIRHAIHRDIGGDHQRISSMDVRYDHNRWRHTLFPLWISAFRYHDKIYRVTVNAQTGEVAGERPWSVFKITLLVIVILAAIIGGVVLYQKYKKPQPTAALIERTEPVVAGPPFGAASVLRRDQLV
ncbi:MAG: hypothetical protein AB7O24_20805 [Kofleriaceae bacterium]